MDYCGLLFIMWIIVHVRMVTLHRLWVDVASKTSLTYEIPLRSNFQRVPVERYIGGPIAETLVVFAGQHHVSTSDARG